MQTERSRLRNEGRKVVFTNGCFDILHAGHLNCLIAARKLGDVLIVGMNSDNSIRRYKGEKRPIISENERAFMLAGLEVVDYVVVFDEDEPYSLVCELLPDILVKGSDWTHYISGRDVVEKHGGRVVLLPLVEGLSTTNIVQKVLQAQKGAPGI